MTQVSYMIFDLAPINILGPNLKILLGFLEFGTKKYGSQIKN